MRLRHAIAPGYIALCLLFGGATQGGFLANMLLQLLAIPIIIWSILTRREGGSARGARSLFILIGLIFAVGLFQLVPLPPSIWTHLPGRASAAAGYAALGLPVPWMPISLTPSATLFDLLWLLPAVATLLSIVRLGAYRASWIAIVVLVATGISVFMGAAQLSGGVNSPFYLYEITNEDAPVGFFANANHLATLMLMAIPLLAAMHVRALRRRGRRQSSLPLVYGAMFAVIAVGLIMNGSLAGLGLAVPIVGASLLLIWPLSKRFAWWAIPLLAVLAAGSVVLVFTAPFKNNLTGAGATTTQSSRYTSFSTTGRAAADYFPLGSGLGSFVPIYRTYENPANVDIWFMNHAHSDYLELALELGLPGMLLIVVAILWWIRRAVSLWRSESDLFARAAVIASAAALAHSVVDYPLRTAALSSLFAAMIALMTEPRPKGAPRETEEVRGARHLTVD